MIAVDSIRFGWPPCIIAGLTHNSPVDDPVSDCWSFRSGYMKARQPHLAAGVKERARSQKLPRSSRSECSHSRLQQ